MLLAFAAILLYSFGGDKNSMYAPPSTYYRYAFTADTITNTEIDTLTLPEKIYSSYTFCYSVVRTNLSGTTNVKVFLDESNLTTGNTDWITIDSTASTGATPDRIKVPIVYGVRHRLRVVGAGTQSSIFAIQATGKKQ